MKRNIMKYSLLALLMLPLTGCSDFLTVEQKGKTTIPSFLSDPRGLQAGLIGAYNKFYTYYDGEFSKYSEVAGNMCYVNQSSGSSVLDQYNFILNPENATTAYYIWYRINEAQANANNIIQYAPIVEAAYPAAADKCKKILGQALLLRALCHFDLVRVYAQPYNYTADASHLGVPVLTKTPGPNDNPARATVKSVYSQVLSDLSQAAGLLTDEVATDRFYGSLQAVNAMFSRVYLYMEDWQNALDYAERAIANKSLAHGADYINMYMDLNVSGEAIFRLNGHDMSGKLKEFYTLECFPADTLISLYDSDDIRLPLLQQSGTNKCIKYAATVVPDRQDKHEDPIIFRLSEMYLNAAEAAWNLGRYNDARSYIRAIVERAVGSLKAQAVLSGCSDADLINLIRTERVKELCFEGHNFFDITRWKQDLVRERNTPSMVQKIAYPSNLFILPIPRYELNANENMLPNPNNN